MGDYGMMLPRALDHSHEQFRLLSDFHLSFSQVLYPPLNCSQTSSPQLSNNIVPTSDRCFPGNPALQEVTMLVNSASDEVRE